MATAVFLGDVAAPNLCTAFVSCTVSSCCPIISSGHARTVDNNYIGYNSMVAVSKNLVKLVHIVGAPPPTHMTNIHTLLHGMLYIHV